MTLASNLAASWAAFKAAGMLTAATWAPGSSPGGVAADVMLDAPGDRVLEGVAVGDLALTYRSADWPSVRANDRITIGATLYYADAPLAIEDGLLSRVALRRLRD